MVKILKGIKDKNTYFKKTDFESVFEAYDVFENRSNNQIPYTYLIQALEKINIFYSKEEFLEAYPQYKLEKGVKKGDFVSIMEK